MLRYLHLYKTEKQKQEKPTKIRSPILKSEIKWTEAIKLKKGILDLKKKTETERGKQLIIQNQKNL